MTEPPIVCTLTSAELAADRAELLPGLVASAVERRWLDDGVQLEFDASSETLLQIARVVDRERQCCRFLEFRLAVPANIGRLRLDVIGPAGSRDLLATLFGADW